MGDYEEERDEPALCIDTDERVKRKLELFLQYLKENNGEYPDSFEEDLHRLYASVDAEFDALT